MEMIAAARVAIAIAHAADRSGRPPRTANSSAMQTAATKTIASVLVCDRNAAVNAAISRSVDVRIRVESAGAAMIAKAPIATDCAKAFVRLPVVRTANVSGIRW